MKLSEVESFLENFVFQEVCQGKEMLALPSVTRIEKNIIEGNEVFYYINEYWTSKQRQASSLQEISYRACFKPQLPRFFIEMFTEKNDLVYDPFMGRGTTVIEAVLMGRNALGNDINPLSKILTEPRINLPRGEEVLERLLEIEFYPGLRAEIDLSMFYHTDTEAELVSLRQYLEERKRQEREDKVDRWIRMVATNRLTGHSPGFFSIYTLPPNQAASRERQKKINTKRNQFPQYKDVKKIILKKSRSLLKDITPDICKSVNKRGEGALLFSEEAGFTRSIQEGSVQLTVTSPPFLDIVQYSEDNWLRCWFNALKIELIEKKITMAKTVDRWSEVMQKVFYELYRITRRGGWVAFEVGEIRKGKVKLEEYVVPIGIKAGFTCAGVLVNEQDFTKTANIWGINNNSKGTNTNRVVLFHKE
ncbi:DNA methyltransferase [Candidatus Contubernalis alkaliaceticus]|uniref:DNA methyltransferase n=1 Tax=Candidatus Contubernalis alkaliaceticus TaxID=338645 RepID=UPI001F4C42A1|nr:DNA methyltransferase [Candidatus Contubernalis alkalaceticus]